MPSFSKAALARLAQAVQATGPTEVSCDEAAILMARCAATQLSAALIQRQYPALWQHWQFCPDCAAEYALLLEVVQAKATGQLPPVPPTPPLPRLVRPKQLSAAPIFWQQVFPGFALLGAPTRGVSDYAPVEVVFTAGLGRLTVELALEELNPTQRALFCRVVGPELALLEGAPTWLQTEPAGQVIQTAVLDDTGEVVWRALPPGTYTFSVQVAEQEYCLKDIATH